MYLKGYAGPSDVNHGGKLLCIQCLQTPSTDGLETHAEEIAAMRGVHLTVPPRRIADVAVAVVEVDALHGAVYRTALRGWPGLGDGVTVHHHC